MLGLDKIEQLHRIRVADHVKRPDFKGGREFAQDVHGFFTSQGPLQYLVGVLYAPGGHELPRFEHLMKLRHHPVTHLRGDVLEAGDFQGDRFDLFLGHVLKDLGRDLGPQKYHEDRRFLAVGHRKLLICWHAVYPAFTVAFVPPLSDCSGNTIFINLP